jgi:hypothetical protein
MFYPDIQAALAKERHNTMLAEAAAARLARQGRKHGGTAGYLAHLRSGGQRRRPDCCATCAPALSAADPAPWSTRLPWQPAKSRIATGVP